MQKSENTTIRKSENTTMLKSENIIMRNSQNTTMRRHDKTETEVKVRHCVIMSYCRTFSVVFSFFLSRKLKKKQNHEDTTKSNFVVFSHFNSFVF